MKNNKKSSLLVRVVVLVFWLILWQVATCLIDNPILLAGPIQVLVRLGEELRTISFYQSVLGTILRILAGFFSGFVAGVVIGSISTRYRAMHLLLEPLVSAMKSIPVATFVVLILIWVGSKNLAIPISFLVVFPHIYIHTRTGVMQTDPNLIVMAERFHMRTLNRIFFIYRPALMPYLKSAAKITVGMSFKSGIAAEVIGIPEYSIGGDIYLSKVYLDTTGVLSWTVVVLILSSLCERMILLLLELLGKWKLQPLCGKRRAEKVAFSLPSMIREYESGMTIHTLPLDLEAGGCYGMMGPSGCGKTTWFEMISGMPEIHTASVFQEDRLCLEYSAVDNVRMTCMKNCQNDITEALIKLLPKDSIDKPVAQLSGGMKRRVAVVRACLSGGNLLLLDEPFTGLDKENRECTAKFITEYRMGRTLLFTTHQEEDMKLLGAKCVFFSDIDGKECEKEQ